MAKYLKTNSDLLGILNEPALSVAGDGVVATTRTETTTVKWDPADATTEIDFVRTVTLNGDDRILGKTAWAANNVPEIGAIQNAGLGNAAKATLTGESTLTVTSPGDATLYGAVIGDLEVVASLLSSSRQYCTHPSIRTIYKGEITALNGANSITVKFSFPAIEGTKVPGLGDAEIIVRNIKQQAQSDPFTIEIV